eukprot:gnl/Chilomastix_caulleri/7706.p1 GENE.gnl/Chilomastix_caulleri/7706~~gnl/Chilomastix_caulleri/7706.p1  ORF type:complete len:88 (+),score=16.04 gnl/Chilomastix_caulleri/7706:37-300(+)
MRCRYQRQVWEDHLIFSSLHHLHRKNPNKGMRLLDDGVFCVGSDEQDGLHECIGYMGCQSIVRLYQDIFLIHNGKTENWCLAKIIVP